MQKKTVPLNSVSLIERKFTTNIGKCHTTKNKLSYVVRRLPLIQVVFAFEERRGRRKEIEPQLTFFHIWVKISRYLFDYSLLTSYFIIFKVPASMFLFG